MDSALFALDYRLREGIKADDIIKKISETPIKNIRSGDQDILTLRDSLDKNVKSLLLILRE